MRRTALLTAALLCGGCQPLAPEEYDEDVGEVVAIPGPAAVARRGTRPTRTPPAPPAAQVAAARARPAEPVVSSPPFRLVSAARHERLAKFWPRTDSARLKEVRALDPLLYTEDEVPRLYQVWDERFGGVIPADGRRPTANLEFPWRGPAGTVFGDNSKAVRFVHLPGPVEWWRGETLDGRFTRFRWRYPAGTVFGELLTVRGPSGFDYTYEVRTREKRADGSWSVASYRPFPTEDDYREALARFGVEYEAPDGYRRSVDSGHRANAFRDTAVEVTLPPLPEETVERLLLETPFKPARGKVWREGAASPRVDGFGIVPNGYLGMFMPVDNISCMRCHEDAGTVVNLDGEGRWRLRGDDGIFTFHPFAADGTLRLNERLADAGLLTHLEGMP